ncbi:jg20359 [Pararge aegeria aegeria]|uniref:Jg20359 protein n=1 Tax=Pararge aegeria aegeria TaxID=348720 RepID=A0A8S4RAW9_9NEOP|nr:jg20359 [Pararge aegeria aegeria]
MERAVIGVSLRNKIRNKEIPRRTRVTDIAQQVAKQKWQWDQGPKVLECKVRPRTGKPSVGRSQRGGQTFNESLGAAGNKRPRIDFGAP